ncbi:MAG: HRDC domain-containing protein [Undibacterium sp.]|nr:HRDC domain-containing protein [Opitutaceae bacterium]
MISRFLSPTVRRFLGVKPAGPAAAPREVPRQAQTARPAHYTLLDQPGSLSPLLAALGRVDEVFLDTEADNMYHYKTRVCLFQLLVDGEIFLVDVLAPGLGVEPLLAVLARKHLVMHGSDFDLRLLHDFCGFRAKSIFDTMLAAQLLGRQRIGLAALLHEHFGVTVDKSGQKANWSQRPITPKLLAYAALDVWHLPALRDLLTRELAGLDRLDWLDQQCTAQIEAGTQGFAPATEHDWRIGRSERLRGVGLPVLHSVWHWRETTAERIDTPPFKVCNNDLLLDIAYAAEDGQSEAVILAQVNLGKRHDRLISTLATALHAGFETDPQSLPKRPGRDAGRRSLAQAELARLDRIKEDRDLIATKLAIEATLIANRGQLSQLALTPGAIDEVLLPWQADLLRAVPSLQPV